MYPTKTFRIHSCIQRMLKCDVILNSPPPILQNPVYASGRSLLKRQNCNRGQMD